MSFGVGCQNSAAPPASQLSVRYPMSVGFTDGIEFENERQIAPGVTQHFQSRADKPLTINTITIDSTAPGLVFETEAGEDRLGVNETALSIVERNLDPDSRPIVMINAGFWGGGGKPVNMFVDEGIIWKAPRKGYGEREGKWNTVFAFDDEGNFLIDQPVDFTMSLRGPSDQYLLIDQVNYHEGSSYACVYTWPKGEQTEELREGQSQIVLNLPGGEWLPNEPATVTVRELNHEKTAILDKNTVVIHADEPIPQWIEPGAQLTLDARFPGLDGKVIGVVGGIPQLIRDGVVDPITYGKEEGIRDAFVTDRHPRTAVGIKEDGKTLVFVVVDGRQSKRSIGISLPDLAEYMKELGCVQALNVDGGGSSTMMVRNELVSFPSDAGGPRKIINGIMIRRDTPVGDIETLNVQPQDVMLPSGSSIEIAVVGEDQDGEPIALDSAVKYSVEGQGATGKVVDGLFTVEGEGTVTLTAKKGRSKGKATYQVAKAASLQAFPGKLLLDQGDSVQILVEPKSEKGETFFGNVILPKADVPDFLQFDIPSRTVTALADGVGELTISLGDLQCKVPIAVGQYGVQPASGFDELLAEDIESLLNTLIYKPELTGLSLSTDVVNEGAASWKMAYGMAPGGTSKIGLNLNAELPGDPLEVGLWVYGDGQGQWLRGVVKDANGQKFGLDFTDSGNGVNWKDEWKFLRTQIQSPSSARNGAPAPKPPLVVTEIYLVQPQEAAKRDGAIYFDGLCAVGLPEQ
jgi:Phosphodiester glycosidase